MSLNLSSEKFRRSTLEQKASTSTFSPSSKDESKVVVDEEIESADIILHKSSVCASSFVFQGVRFSPRIIEFIDAFEGKQFATKITIQNIGRDPVMVKIGEPMSFIFQLKKPIRRAKFLASGSTITRYVTYSYHNDDIVQKSQIPIQVNNKLVDYPIIVKRALPEIEVQPSDLNFKIVNLGASAKTLILTICNYGGKRTKFEIDLGKNDLDLVVSPARGTITAKNQVTIEVEMMGLNEGKYFKELWVTTSEMSIRVPVTVEVLRPRLEIVHPNVTEDFTLIDFKPAFKGTQRADCFLLQNYSAETTLFITLADINGNLQFLNEARKIHETFNMFMLTAEEGRLEPFESRMLTVLFRPKAAVIKKGWHCKEGEKKKKACWEHLVFFRINRVHCIERKELVKVEAKPVLNIVREKSKVTMQSAISFTNFNTEMLRPNHESDFFPEVVDTKSFESRMSITTPSDEKILRLCLHGTAIDLDILTQPSCLEFEELFVSETKNKVLKLTNDTIVAVKYKFHKTTNIKIKPNTGWLQPRKAFEFLVTLLPTCTGTFERKLKIEIFAQSDVVFETDKDFVSIAEIYVPVRYVVRLASENPKPKINLGITPIITDEVGLGKELMTYNSKFDKPYAAMLSSLLENFKPKWMVNEPDQERKVKNAIIAFPNDRTRNFYSWPKEKICRTIFKGLFRYSPPEDTTYSLTLEEMDKKKQHRIYWNNYLKTLENIRKLNLLEPNKPKDYEVTCLNHNMEDFKFSVKSPTGGPVLKLKDLIQKKESLPRHALVPLSPLFLSNINVEPKLINFGTVAINTLVHEKLTLHNLNPFAISIRFVPGKSAVTVRDSGTIIILPLFTKFFWVSFQTKDLGRYYGFLNYVINGSHEFKITISAFVTMKTLVLEDKNLVVEFGNFPEKNAFQPRSTFLELGNLLKSSIKYRWEKPMDSPFLTDIIEGEVPPKTQILTEFKFALSPDKPFYSEVNLISESGDSELIKLVHPMKKVAVNFVTTKVDMKDVPLNLVTKIAPLIENACYHDVIFQVANWNPMPGVIVEPKNGVLKPRSLSPIYIRVKIPVIMKFSFEVILQVHMLTKISVKVMGNVVLPKIRISPTEVWMKKICPQSFDEVQLCIENAGTTPAELEIDFKAWPEYSVNNDNKRIYLPPSKTSKVLVHFHPKDIARYVFYLPLTINNILGPPIIQEPETENVSFYISEEEINFHDFGSVVSTKTFNFKIPCICFNSNVSASLLTVTPLNIVFNSSESDDKFQPETIVFENNFMEEDVTFCIRTDNLGENKSSFDLVPEQNQDVIFRTKSIKAVLKKGEKLVMKVFFIPKKPGIHSLDVPVFVKSYFKDAVYTYINLKGEVKQPTLVTDHDEIHFPPLPLDIGCEVVITVCAENYSSPDSISWAVWDPHDGGEILSNYLSIKWKDEPIINPDLNFQTFRVEITFISNIPTSFKNYVVFLDTAGNYCTVLVSGIADNSFASIHGFISVKSSLYKLIRETPPILPSALEDDINYYCPVKLVNDGKIHSKAFKKGISICSFPSEGYSNEGLSHQEKVCPAPIDKGPKLVIQMSKSMTKPTQLNYVNLSKNSVFCKSKYSDSNVNTPIKSKSKIYSFASGNYKDSSNNERTLSSALEFKSNITTNFPEENTTYAKHIQNTIAYVERWMYEVIMQCEQYFLIPYSFQKIKTMEKISKKRPNLIKETKEKDFFDFLEKIISLNNFTQRPASEENEKIDSIYTIYNELLRFLQSQGCLVSCIKPEHLLNYENYLIYVENRSPSDTFKWRNVEPYKMFSLKILKDQTVSATKINSDKPMNLSSSSFLYTRQSWRKSFFNGQKAESEVTLHDDLEEEEKNEEVEKVKQQIEATRQLVEGKQFTYKYALLNEEEFKIRSSQAWLDIVIQIFRSLILSKVFYKNTVPDVVTIKMGARVFVENVELKNHAFLHHPRGFYTHPESLICNVFSVQERVLLMWLNYHYAIQKDILWKHVRGNNAPLLNKVVNSFDKDLSDSLVLIAVTAAHCPYIVEDYFSDIFTTPNTQNKIYHNAGKLTLAWKMLNLGLTVESMDIVNPNPLFMLMLVVQLYEVLPTLHPKFLISFAAPLSSEVSRVIQIKNDTDEVVYYEPKFMEECVGLFCLLNFPSLIELKPHRTTDIQIIFHARKIKRVTATLILFGSVISPNFAKHLTFYLEGEPSELTESSKFAFTAPLYKVLCVDVPVTSPYFEPTTYEIWYTTNKPFYKEYVDISSFMKPWSKIWNRKVSRRLYLQKHEITFTEEKSSVLGVTVACFTEEDRCFWLMFRSPEIGDFIITIHIKVSKKAPLSIINASYLEQRPEYFCSEKISDFRILSENTCSFETEIAVPTRNEPLWDSLKYMFLKTLHNQEKAFWAEHFETDIGICLILWLTNDDEESAVVDEFIHLLQTQVTYNLKIQSPNSKYVTIPEKIEIEDVRKNTEIRIPVHISKNAPKKLKLNLTMTSENGREIRNYKILLNPTPFKKEKIVKNTSAVNENCGPCWPPA